MRQANIYYCDQLAEMLTEEENGYPFQYDTSYLSSEHPNAISLTMPLTNEPYRSLVLFPFFDGLIPEGWLLDIAEKKVGRLIAETVCPCSWLVAKIASYCTHHKRRVAMKRCLYCYKELEEGQKDFYPRCAKKIFGCTTAPVLPYTRGQIAELATEVICSQSTLTGVQPKLSIGINKQRGDDVQRFPIVGLWGRYILKPQTDAFRSLPEVEDLTMHLAEAAKIQVVPHSLIRFSMIATRHSKQTL